jgi:hypothetical protein
MPRDASGNYTTPAGQPVTSGTTISSTVFNALVNDLKTEMTDSLSRSGNGGMLVPLPFADGSVSAPGISFDNETSSGLYRAGAKDVRLTVFGTYRQRWTDTLITFNEAVSGTDATFSGTSTLATVAGNLTLSALQKNLWVTANATAALTEGAGTLTDVAGVTKTVSDSKRYSVRVQGVYVQSSAGGSVDFQMSGVAVTWMDYWLSIDGAATVAHVTSETTMNAGTADTNRHLFEINGFFITGIGGGRTLKLQAARSGGAGTLTLDHATMSITEV